MMNDNNDNNNINENDLKFVALNIKIGDKAKQTPLYGVATYSLSETHWKLLYNYNKQELWSMLKFLNKDSQSILTRACLQLHFPFIHWILETIRKEFGFNIMENIDKYLIENDNNNSNEMNLIKDINNANKENQKWQLWIDFLNTADISGKNAIDLALLNENEDVTFDLVKLLVRYGAAVDGTGNKNNNPPIFTAVQKKHAKIVNFLINVCKCDVLVRVFA